MTLKPLFNRLLGLNTDNPYHAYNGSAQPLRYTTYKRSILINLNPHPDKSWTGPRTHSYKLSKLSSTFSSSKASHHKKNRSGETLRTRSSRNSSVSSFGDFFTELPVIPPLRVHHHQSPRPRPPSSVYSQQQEEQEKEDTYTEAAPPPPDTGDMEPPPPAIPLKSPQRVALSCAPKQRFTVSALRKPHGNWV